MTHEELEIITYRAENILPHTYTHLSLSAILVPSSNCTITLLEQCSNSRMDPTKKDSQKHKQQGQLQNPLSSCSNN